MFGWFRKKREEPIEFADNRAAFEYACENLPNRILIEADIPAIVEETRGRGRDGERFFAIRLAGPDGGTSMLACTLAESTDWPEVGDLVGFHIVTIAEELAQEPVPIGFISHVLSPVMVAGKGWRVARNLTPKNIKQPIRF